MQRHQGKSLMMPHQQFVMPAGRSPLSTLNHCCLSFPGGDLGKMWEAGLDPWWVLKESIGKILFEPI